MLFSGYSYAEGDVATDPSLPIYGVDSKAHGGALGYLQTLNLFGRTSNLIVEVPYVWGSTTGQMDDTSARRNVSGFGDLGLALSVNLLGAPSMSREDFQRLRADPRVIVGASLKLIAPTGEYDGDRLINVGSNRWAARAELGAIFPVTPRWLLELETGIWWFEDNDDFLGGTRAQKPVHSVELHVVRRVRPGLWLTFDANYYWGGRSSVDGDPVGDRQKNSRLGATVVVPFARRWALKFAYSGGVVTHSGGDFDTLLVGIQTVLP